MTRETQATLSREEENAIAGGFNDAEDQLITQEHQLAQTDETPSPRAPSERGGIRLLSVLVGVGCVMGIGAACWLLFFGEKNQTRKPTAEAKPTSTSAQPTKSEDDSLKAELAFARQRQAMEQAQQEEKGNKNPEKLAKKNVKKPVGATSATTLNQQEPFLHLHHVLALTVPLAAIARFLDKMLALGLMLPNQQEATHQAPTLKAKTHLLGGSG